MKRQLISALVASALELIALQAASPAQAACLANGATPMTSGPLNPIDGFPEYLTDSNGLSMQRCLDPNLCFFDPIVPSDPFSIQIRSGGEAFYWSATAVLRDAARNTRLTVVMAAETAFLQADPITGAPVDGSQFAFQRLRVVFTAPAAGNYTLVHPYGTETLSVPVASGGRDVFTTIDRGFGPSATFSGPVGPFLVWDSGAPAGFAGDGGAAGAAHAVKGSPCAANFVSLTGRDLQGNPLDLDGLGNATLSTNLFSVQGQIYDGKVQTPLTASRLTYSRAGAVGQIDTFATSTATATVTVQDGPTTPPAALRFPAGVTLASAPSALGGGLDFASTPLTTSVDPLPSHLAVSASDGTSTDPTTLIHPLVDFVKITQADYDPASQTLSVQATSGDQTLRPTLTIREYNRAPGTAISTQAPPASVTVVSTSGGSDTALVRVVAATPPLPPSGLTASNVGATSLTLNWADNASNEAGYEVFRNGVKVASLGANVVSWTDSGLTASTSYNYEVVAINLSGSAGSDALTVSTVALPVAPTIGTATPTGTRTIALTWTDNASDETGYRIERATAATGPFAAVTATAAGATTANDSIGLSTNATYYYRVVTLRGADSSPPSAAVRITTPSAPASPGQPTGTPVSGTQVNLSWADRSSNETAFQVFRRVGTGAYVAVSALLPANTTTYQDRSATPGTTYNYRVDVSGWGGTLQSAASAAVTTPGASTAINLVAVTGLAASLARSPVLTWGDASSNETGYMVRRTPITVNTNGSISTAAPTTFNLPANSTTTTDTPTALNSTVRYEVAALNGTTIGPLASVHTVTTAGGLPTAGRPTLARSLVNGAARVALSWTIPTPTTSVGGYEIQRCAGANCTSYAKLTGPAVNTTGTVDGRTTLGYTDTTTARGTTYSYRVRAVGGAGTGLVGTFGTSRSITTQ